MEYSQSKLRYSQSKSKYSGKSAKRSNILCYFHYI